MALIDQQKLLQGVGIDPNEPSTERPTPQIQGPTLNSAEGASTVASIPPPPVSPKTLRYTEMLPSGKEDPTVPPYDPRYDVPISAGLTPAEQSEAAAVAQQNALAAKDEMINTYKDPTGYLEDKGIQQTYTEDNSYLKDGNGNLLLDANGKPQEDVSLAIDPLDFQLTQKQHAEAALAQADTAGYSPADLEKATAGADVDPVTAAAAKAQAAQDVALRDFETSLLDPEDLHSSLDKIMQEEPMKAASMASQMNSLLAGMEEGKVPTWARPAVTKVEQALAARGISASSVGRDSLFNAIIQAAMPIAQQDATFEQDANKTTYSAKINAIMEDTKMENAALQFNATSINQANQFKTQMQAQIDSQNAARQDAMSQFNASADTDISKFNAQQDTAVAIENANRQDAMSQFNTQQANSVSVENSKGRSAAAQANADRNTRISEVNAASRNSMTQFSETMDNQREQFNATMSAQINQATVQWRRQMNTANTAGQNAVNQANAQNAFNLSNQALTNLWQEVRDEAHWSFLSSESVKDRRAQLEASVLARESSTVSEIGSFLAGLDVDADDIVDGVKEGWKFVSDLWT